MSLGQFNVFSIYLYNKDTADDIDRRWINQEGSK